MEKDERFKNTDEIAARIKKLRNTLKLSQLEFAERIGFAQSLIAQLETGNKEILPRHLKLIGSTYDVRFDWLVTGDGEMFIEKNVATAERMSAQKKAIVDVATALSEEQCANITRIVAALASNLIRLQVVELPVHLRAQVAKAFDDLA